MEFGAKRSNSFIPVIFQEKLREAMHADIYPQYDAVTINSSVKSFRQFIVEVKAKFDLWSWAYHPIHGMEVEEGYHMHDFLADEHPEIYEDPEDPSHHWYPPAGYAKVDRSKRVVEFYDYESPRNPDPKVVAEFLKAVHAVGYKVIGPTAATQAQRKHEDWI